MSRHTTRLRLAAAGFATGALAFAGPSAFGTPAYDVFDAKEGWICGSAEGLVDNHCLNVTSNGKTWNIKVLEPDPRGPQESASTDPSADARPCPHDPSADPDGTWWEFAPGLWVCHHSGTQPS